MQSPVTSFCRHEMKLMHYSHASILLMGVVHELHDSIHQLSEVITRKQWNFSLYFSVASLQYQPKICLSMTNLFNYCDWLWPPSKRVDHLTGKQNYKRSYIVKPSLTFRDTVTGLGYLKILKKTSTFLALYTCPKRFEICFRMHVI